MIGRIVIEGIRPQIDCGRWPARAVAGETLPVRATIFRDGHTVVVAAAVRLLGPVEGQDNPAAPRGTGGPGDSRARPIAVGAGGGSRAVVPRSTRVRMTEVNHGLYLWEGEVTLPRPGLWNIVVEAWTDELATWLDATRKKLDAGRDITLELEEGAQILERAAARLPARLRRPLLDAATGLRDGPGDPAAPLVTDQASRLAAATDPAG